MPNRYLWRGGGTDLGAAADWTDLTTGASPAATRPKFADTASIGAVGRLDATGTEVVGVLTLAADLALDGFLLDAVLDLAGGTIEALAQGTLVIGTAPWAGGAVAVGVGGLLSGSGRIDAAVALAGGSVVASGGALALFGSVGGAGTLGIAAGATLFAAAAVGAAASVAFEAAAGTLELFAPHDFAAPISGFAAGDVIDLADAAPAALTWNAGTLSVDGAALVLPGVAATAQFLLLPDGMGGSALSLAPADTALPGSAGTLALGHAGGIAVYGGAGSAGRVAAAGTVALAGSLHATSLAAPALLAVTGGGRLDAGAITLSGTLAALAGGVVSAGTLTLAGGTLSADIASGIAVGGYGASGTVAIAAGATLSGTGRIDAPLTLGGELRVGAGALGLFGAVGGSGTVELGAGATLFAAADLVGPTIAFTAPGATLMASGKLSVALAGLAIGDAIDLAVTAAQALATVAALPVLGTPPSRVFAAAADGRGGTLLTVVACFAAATRIATPHGEMPVELLRPGDAVLTPDGPRRLVWTGRSRVAAPELRPVRIAAGALGRGRPRRDLLLSPEHALLDGALLRPAAAWLGRPGITRDPAGVIDYHHVALARHDLLLAEGVWAESYLPDGAPSGFDVEHGRRPRALQPCRVRQQGQGVAALPTGPAGPLRGHVERMLRQRRRLRIVGWALDAAPPVVLEVRCDRRVITRFVADHWRSDLDRAGLADGRCGFDIMLAGPAAPLTVHRFSDGLQLPVCPG